MFEDIHEIAENSAYLKAVEEKDVNLEMLEQLPPYDDLKDLEENLRQQKLLTFDKIFAENTGFYLIKCFLIAEYVVDKAIFIKDVEMFRSMRFESARKKVAKLLFERFVAEDSESDRKFPEGSSVFVLVKQYLNKEEDEKTDKLPSTSQPVITIVPSNPSTANPVNLTANVNVNPQSPPSLSTGQSAPLREQKEEKKEEKVKDPQQQMQGQQDKSGIRLASSSANSTINLHPDSVLGLKGEKKDPKETILQIGNKCNPIGVYGKAVARIKERIAKNEAPKDLFDEVAQQVMNDLRLDVFPRFKQSEFYKRYVRTKFIETVKVTVKDFTTFRVLGRGGFGAVHACRKINSGTLYAMKCINKRLVKVKSALDNVLEERNVLTMMKSTFVTNLKYALQDEDTLYLIMDLMLGGDLKFHLINAGRFTEKRARFYAAEVLLGLEHVHSNNVIYRDMKLENVLLDHNGHCKISDLGLAVITKTKIKGYAGTPGYTAPEMIKNKLYGPSADIFSYGVMLYRMLCGSKPFKGKADRDLDRAVVDKKPVFPKEIFSKDAVTLLTGLLQKRPEHRLGCGDKGIEEIKEHPFFEAIDWGLLEAGYLDPPFIPNKFDVNAASLKDIGDFDKNKYKNVKLDERFKQRVKNFHWVSIKALQEEMVLVLEKADEGVNFRKFDKQPQKAQQAPPPNSARCCVIL